MSSTEDLAIIEEGELHHVQDDEAEANVEYSNTSSNKSTILNSVEDIFNLKEGELHLSVAQDDIPGANSGLMNLTGVVCSELPIDDEFLHQNIPSPNRAKSSPSYADIAKKKSIDSSGSSSDDSIEKLSKKAGKKSRKESREEEAERLKMQESQSTIEMYYGRSKRKRPIKGVITPSHPSK